LKSLIDGNPKMITTGKIPDSHLIFLDETWKSNEGVLNSLLTAMNERRYTNESETVDIPAISFMGASNEIPNFSDPAEKILRPLYDRFEMKVQKKGLKQYRRRERISKGYGDIVVCIDESSSMSGDPIAWAKAVALVLLDFATQNGRSCAMVRFASKGSTQTHIFTKDSTTEEIFSFAESYLCGGTDFEEPLTQAVTLIEQGGFRDADIVFLTDGECAIGEEFAGWFCEQKEQLRFTVKGIVMDAGSPGFPFSLTPFCEKVYRLSEMGCNQVAGSIIMKIA
jgi:uncharacterized protein with von Willebrand factor type A (vWA) domain